MSDNGEAIDFGFSILDFRLEEDLGQAERAISFSSPFLLSSSPSPFTERESGSQVKITNAGSLHGCNLCFTGPKLPPPMALFSKRLRTRRSLLAVQPGEKSMSLGKRLLIGNALMLCIVVAETLLDVDVISFEAIPSLLRTAALRAIVLALFINAIMFLVYFGKRLAQRHTSNRSRVMRMMVEAGVLMLSSGIVLGVMFLVNNYSITFHGLSGTAGTVLGIVIFSFLSALVGVLVLSIKELIRWRRRRTSLLSQSDLLTAEFQAARSVQRSLLPEEDARLFGFDISGTTVPAVEIGGDYYDYITFADGAKGIIVADASGKGIPAALVMAKFQGMAQALSIHVESPEEFFIGLNDTLRIRLDRHSFITVGMVTIDFDDHITFFRAGHNPLFLYCAASGSIETLKPPGLALGLTHGTMLGSSLKPERFDMREGDIALLYSDGLTEATNAQGEEYGEVRVADSLKSASRRCTSAAEIRALLLADLANFVGAAEPHDDVTVVVVKKV
jgi:serine phosphatase RsbU (regulator of sigma subunit)